MEKFAGRTILHLLNIARASIPLNNIKVFSRFYVFCYL